MFQLLWSINSMLPLDFMLFESTEQIGEGENCLEFTLTFPSCSRVLLTGLTRRCILWASQKSRLSHRKEEGKKRRVAVLLCVAEPPSVWVRVRHRMQRNSLQHSSYPASFNQDPLLHYQQHHYPFLSLLQLPSLNWDLRWETKISMHATHLL